MHLCECKQRGRQVGIALGSLRRNKSCSHTSPPCSLMEGGTWYQLHMRTRLQERTARNISAHPVPCCFSLLEMHFLHLRAGTRHRLKTEGCWVSLCFLNALVTFEVKSAEPGNSCQTWQHGQALARVQEPQSSLYVSWAIIKGLNLTPKGYCSKSVHQHTFCMECKGSKYLENEAFNTSNAPITFLHITLWRQLFLSAQQKGVLSIAYKQLQFSLNLNSFVCERTRERQELYYGCTPLCSLNLFPWSLSKMKWYSIKNKPYPGTSVAALSQGSNT